MPRVYIHIALQEKVLNCFAGSKEQLKRDCRLDGGFAAFAKIGAEEQVMLPVSSIKSARNSVYR